MCDVDTALRREGGGGVEPTTRAVNDVHAS